MKKKFSFPAFAGISAVLLVLVLFWSPLFDYTAEARLWADYETAWPLFIIPPVTFWIVGAAAYICAAGKGYFRRCLPPLFVGGALTLYIIVWVADQLVFCFFRSGLALDLLDPLHILLPLSSGTFKRFIPYLIYALAGYLTAYGLYGREKTK